MAQCMIEESFPFKVGGDIGREQMRRSGGEDAVGDVIAGLFPREAHEAIVKSNSLDICLPRDGMIPASKEEIHIIMPLENTDLEGTPTVIILDSQPGGLLFIP